jgi:hypothetical protein
MKTKPFNLEEAKAGKPVVVRWNGSLTACRILAFDLRHDLYPLAVAVSTPSGAVELLSFTEKGIQFTDGSGFMLLMRVEPTIRPWKDLSEVPLDAWFRLKGGNSVRKISEVELRTTVRPIELFGSWHGLDGVFRCFEHSLDNGKTWLTCGLEE